MASEQYLTDRLFFAQVTDRLFFAQALITDRLFFAQALITDRLFFAQALITDRDAETALTATATRTSPQWAQSRRRRPVRRYAFPP
ncbi:hypothetical protein H7J06_08195 [Mycobacterium hodleri]|uniref:hypothetical protein n=1 Tax=Mycolicibacterium hodleri TaxID=49897 RepID=UPI0021F3A13A|nr:hypothetical protein [Mycolicibacterium hodleri]MCV7132968.1 hypothetical protein [Mycolicibacterium hodleri]